MAVELVGWAAAEAPPLEIGEGASLEGEGSCGFVVCVQFWKRLRSCQMASSWASITAEGVSLRALARKWRACVSRSA